MSNKATKKSNLDVAKEIAKRYINRPVLDDGKNTKITEVCVILEESSVYVNSPIDAIQEYASKRGYTLVIVMEKGKVAGQAVQEEETEEVEEATDEESGKSKSKKGKK